MNEARHHSFPMVGPPDGRGSGAEWSVPGGRRLPAVPFHEREEERLDQLRLTDLLDSPPEEDFDGLAALAAHVCGWPVALVSFVDAHRQWFKARRGLDLEETPRRVAFCAHAILQEGIFEVPDALGDPRFAANPLVRRAPHLRAYAGVPLRDRESGLPLGTLCVLHHRPAQLAEPQRLALLQLARQAERLIALRTRLCLDAATVAHDLSNVLMGLELAGEMSADGGIRGDELRPMVSHLRALVAQLRSRSPRRPAGPVDLREMLVENRHLLDSITGGRLQLDLPIVGVPVLGEKDELLRVLVNLLTNARTACEGQEEAPVLVVLRGRGGWARLEVRDRGRGMAPELVARAFEQGVSGWNNRRGTGLGLAFVGTVARRHGGQARIDSEPGVGTSVVVELPLDEARAWHQVL